jgi:hypothetical protein
MFGSAMSQSGIAAFLGVTVSTLNHWITEGQRANEAWQDKGIPIPKDRRAWAEFSVEAHRARAAFMLARLNNIAQAGDGGDWKADAWTLKVMDRDRYGDKQQIDAQVSTNVVTLYPTSGDTISTTLIDGGDS